MPLQCCKFARIRGDPMPMLFIKLNTVSSVHVRAMFCLCEQVLLSQNASVKY